MQKTLNFDEMRIIVRNQNEIKKLQLKKLEIIQQIKNIRKQSKEILGRE